MEDNTNQPAEQLPPEDQKTMIDIANAKQADEREREQKCTAAIQSACEEFGCDIDIAMRISQTGVTPEIKIIAR